MLKRVERRNRFADIGSSFRSEVEVGERAALARGSKNISEVPTVTRARPYQIRKPCKRVT